VTAFNSALNRKAKNEDERVFGKNIPVNIIENLISVDSGSFEVIEKMNLIRHLFNPSKYLILRIPVCPSRNILESRELPYQFREVPP